MIIDVHAHLITDSKQQCEENYQKLERRMDGAGIDYSLVMTIFDEEYFHPRKDNDIIIETAQNHPRILPIAAFDHTHSDESTRAIQEYLDNGLIVGIKFFTGYQYFHPTSQDLDEVLDLAQEYDVPVIFHTGTTSTDAKARLKFCSNPLDIDDLAYHRSKLRMSCAHFNAPNFMQMAPVIEQRADTVYVDLSGLFYGSSDRNQNPYITTLEQLLEQAITYLESADNLMFGSDDPYCTQKESVKFLQQFLEECEYPGEYSTKIFSQNAKNFFKLKTAGGRLVRNE